MNHRRIRAGTDRNIEMTLRFGHVSWATVLLVTFSKNIM